MPDVLDLPVRVLALCLGLALWLLQYFLINNLTQRARPRFRSSSAVDALIPFVPGFIVVYFSTYILGALPPLFVADTSLFIKIGISYAVITIIGSAIHLRYPSRVERFQPGRRPGASSRLITWFQSVCKPYGNFPSIHVAFSMLAVITAFVVLGPAVGGLFLVWALLIALSTLATKQHYLLDVAAGGALGGGVTILVFLLL